MEQAELQRTEGGSPVQGWLRAWAGEREETPLGTCESFPPGAGLRASEKSLCAWGRWKDTQITHWNFQPTRDPWSWRCVDVQGAASERFQSLEELVSILPCWGGAWRNR